MSDARPTIWDRRISRRDFLRRAGQSALAIPTLAGLAAACSVGGSAIKPTPTGSLSPLPPLANELIVANWEFYIDPAVPKQFKAATGIDIEYHGKAIPDNETFYGIIRPDLRAGKPTGWDVIVVTDWLVAKMARFGYLEPLHLDKIPNLAANVDPLYLDPVYDPGNVYSVPWQSGLTGIAYDERLTGRPITSLEDLFDPELKGTEKVGMFTEMRDTMNLMLLNVGVPDLQQATEADLEKVRDKLLKQRRDGIVRQYYDNSYVDALDRGDISMTIAWSGDVLQLTLSNPNIHFIIPDEGGLVWVDNAVIPVGAAHPADAHEWFNYNLDLEVAAQNAEYINYITPVQKSQDLIKQHAAAATKPKDKAFLEGVANSGLVFPDADTKSRVQGYKLLEGAEERFWDEIFDEVKFS
jgi:spermidine/putrescine transport system substrate-binding protein